MLYHVISCYAMLYHVIPCYTISYHVIPCYTMLYHVIPCYTMSYHVISCHTMSPNPFNWSPKLGDPMNKIILRTFLAQFGLVYCWPLCRPPCPPPYRPPCPTRGWRDAFFDFRDKIEILLPSVLCLETRPRFFHLI